MKRFLIEILFFLLPLVIFAFTAEILLRNIPNDYRNKRIYLDEHAEEVEVLALGLSHAFNGINPDYFSMKTYNAAYVSQSIDMDWQIIKKYDEHWKNLEFILLPISYPTMFERLETAPESWQIKNYVLYYKMNISNKIKDNSEILGNKLWYSMYRIMQYYVLKKSPLLSTDNGWRSRPSEEIDMEKDGKERATLHTIDNPACFQKNVEYLETILEYAENHNITVILYTPPAYKSYVENLNKKQLDETRNIALLIVKEYQNVYYFDMLKDNSFLLSDYADSDHLNPSGAEKLSRKMNYIIFSIENERQIVSQQGN